MPWWRRSRPGLVVTDSRASSEGLDSAVRQLQEQIVALRAVTSRLERVATEPREGNDRCE